ncbi:DDT domain-containing protein PTM [Rhododendron vialii]|uniref:DDT domain-containing protein PTM n=1 Tax=Rhododendron vialii TaxID=182163 RepID=UPI00265E8D41|nr:DDT domain-containing protein PTM [Rhododendron vialii]
MAELVGKTVKKEFKGFGFFNGVVSSFDPSTGLFEIVYDDGDSEELEFQEISSLLENGSGSILDNHQSTCAAADVTKRKPRKRRRVGDDSGTIINSHSNLVMGISSGEGLKEDTISVTENNTSCGNGVRSENWLNLNDGFDLNHGLNLNDDGLGLNDNELDSNDGFDLNVDSERRLEKKNVAFIDLNLDANGESEENLKEEDLVVSVVVGTQKTERCFDLNLGLDEEIKNSDSECEGQLEENGSFCLVNETQKRDMEETRMEVIGGYSESAVRDPCVRLSEEVPKGSGVSLGSKGEDASSGAMCSTDILSSEVQLTEMLPDTGTPVDHSSYQGNSESTCKERKRRKRQKSLDNVDCATERASRRRSSSRVAVANCTENHVSSGARSVAYDEVSPPGAIEAKDFPSSELEVEAGFPDGTPLDHGYGGSTGSTRKGRRGRKRKELLDSVDSARETVLRRSSRRLAATLSDQTCVSSGAMLQELNEAHPSPAVSVVLEESEEYNVLPSKLLLPPSSTNLNLDGIPILDLFSVYTCLRSFSTLLFLSPFELEDFVAALKSKVPNFLFDSIHVSLLQTLRRHLEFLSEENSQSASNCLRSLNWDFLDLITWPMFMGEYLLTHGSELKPGLDLCKLKLFESEYYEQPTLVKIEILRCLCDDMMEVEGIRSELNRRTLAIELNINTDRIHRNIKIEASRKRTSLDISGGSCLTEDVVDEATDGNSDECRLCKMDGSLICCDGCPEAYHLKCVGVANCLLPEGDWYCPECMIDKDKPWLKMGKSIRGAELLGVDPYGRFYYSSCGYLLVSDSCESGVSYHYYRGNDLASVIEALMSSDTLYRPILCAISKQWNIYVKFNGSKSYAGSHRPTVWLETMKGQMPSLAPSETYVRDEISDERKPRVNSIAAQSSGNTDSEVSALVNNEPVTLNNSMKMENPLTSSEGSAETSLATRIHNFGKTGISKDSEIQGTIVSVTIDLGAKRGKNMESSDYVNNYNFARKAALVVEELTGNSSDKINVGSTKSLEDIISAQLKAISKKATKFSWPSIQNLNAVARREKCGWCFSCRAPDDDEDCFFNMNDSAPDSTSEIIDLGAKRNKKGHLVDVVGYMLCFEDRLRAFLLGPWLNPHYTKIWRNSVVKASEVDSLKHLLLMLESNLRPLALSAEWVKHVDSVATLGSASHVMTSSLRVSSKHGIGGKRGRNSDLKPNPSSKAATGLGLFWWRGGRLSRELFKWKVLPRSLASKAARQAGYAKIPGILYPDSSEFANRSKNVAWRAAVETSRSVEQLALQVRELDSNIRWDEIENTNLLSKMDQFRKSVKSFKKAIIRRKCSEGAVVKYLLDFGKRRFIPDIVLTQGSRFEESSSGRKKYWLEEPHVPLFLLKTFEERRIARKTNKMSSGKLHWNDRVAKKTSKKRGFSYLFAKAERSENYQCGQCNKDVLIREAVSCQHCQGFFHKRHVRKSARAITVECTYTCHKCQAGNRVKVAANHVKVAAKKGKAQSQKSTKVSTVCRILRSNASKKACKNKKQIQRQKNKKDTVVLPLRRSARRIQIVSLPTKKVGGRKKKKGRQIKPKKEISKKPKKCTWQKKRTGIYHSYWLNGLLLSRKPNDDRVENFRSKVLLAHCDQLSDVVDQPKCSLCREQEFSSMLNYVGCEICGDWFHGDAIGLGVENISNLIGFRCHECRNREPPVCPHLHSSKTDRTQSGESNHMEIECAEEVSNVTAPPTEVLEENKSHTDEESKNIHLNDDYSHKDQESEIFLKSNQLEAENEHLAQNGTENSIRNSSMESNEHVSLVESASDIDRGDIEAVTDVIDTEMALLAHNNTEKGSLEQKSLVDSSELPCQANAASGETVDGQETML